ncbi:MULTISPECIES: VIT1/CCC1 transporter family protein [Streptomyces]|uniref:VIT1/CCC1 transporter family protein n=1 Tax=Streptomyces TaxID=1883 RepID=UPI0018849FD4|nr:MULTISPECIES: VIT1/CCC1 transporter family protein [Streptomyces]MBF8173288.1 VIT1/CCC1 transporter family protein [Streptomyces olivaceus]MBZ6131809.1 VIT1/CCC1 transporter family protein [Streptomyces olivaceus]MBZ6142080.1 VIT1/CCC1 transporter family protein [Streptomyces olivaceus]MBZ6169851.1 VIT1/CCC1 transporter family protein [Streptomyces olivaceus]MBZ6174931.1 VIT1/CCC1 transporter family protein [Streptomyces olivaceus]
MAIIETEAPLHEAHRDNHTHRDVNGGWLRPAVFGAMDGLVSNLALMTGVAGGTASQQTVVISGLAGLAAGAFSMAAGEYTSVASQRELVEAELDVERRELRKHPADEEAELAALYQARGVEPDLAREVARQLSSDPEQALEIHAREELGIDPADLPSPLVAAVSSFGSFALGALLPVLPFLLGAGALWPAVLLALAGLFLCGAVVAKVTARSWWYSGLRQLALGGAAAGVTYALGSLFGTAVG